MVEFDPKTLPCGHPVGELVGNPHDAGGTCYCGACAREAASGRVDSFGTCSRCGYNGPGPRHECKKDIGDVVLEMSMDVRLVAAITHIADYAVRDAVTGGMLGYCSRSDSLYIEYDAHGMTIPEADRIPINVVEVDESPWD